LDAASTGLSLPHDTEPHGSARSNILSEGSDMPQLSEVPEAQRREIFLAIVDAQDRELTVAQSRAFITERFGIDDAQIRAIEREGLDNGWPPL
jgi:hypothetical protein